MARGARSLSVRTQGLSQAGCCVRAVDVAVMVCVVGRSSSCVFFFGRRREEVTEKGRGGWLELAVIVEKDG
eukprot:scaffold17291_cov52-Cyclotella_meneghiniana.AAC.1